ncbi:MAG: hypothetical protein NZ899_09525 [Thermoguttaceae bacterium]|nr:hypothetical protein [Thermoguttaceae bacterium]MDW8079309.1 hypothetical protein [Thermoguttaceae bacterium]
MQVSRAIFVALGLVIWGPTDSATGTASEARLATFVADLTPPVDGHPLIWLTPVKVVETPLLAKGILLEAGGSRYVLCSIDWCGLANSSYRLFVDKTAAAASCPPEHVFVHTVHQHTAPYTDGDAQRLLNAAGFEPLYVDFKFLEEAAGRLAQAVKQAVAQLEPFDQVGFAAVPVAEVASNRRVKTPEGKMLVRYSSCKDPNLRAMPEGLIDPLLRTVTLARDGKPLVRLHFYATHPQSFYGDPRASYDVPGFARERLEKEEAVFQIYFTGCAGNITMGKYNDGSREARDALTERLYKAMAEACRQTRYESLKSLRWKSLPVVLPARSDPGYSPVDMEARMKNPALNPVQRVRAACHLAFHNRASQPFNFCALFINDGVIVGLPGESFVEYQLYAQSLRPGKFVAVAAYGDIATGYICTEVAFSEGGYEPTESALAPEAESVMKEALAQLLKD